MASIAPRLPEPDHGLMSLKFDVGPIVPGEPAGSIAIDLHAPACPSKASKLLFMVPGGGVSRRYFDLRDPIGGNAPEDFSFARAMASAGHFVASVDPAGVGESTRPDDGFALTVERSAAANARALRQLRARLADGTLPGLPALPGLMVIGGGHSAGAMQAVLQQAREPAFDAMLLFCFGTGGLPDLIDADQRAALAEPDGGRARFPDFARRRFEGRGYVPVASRERDTPAGRAMREVHDLLGAVIGVHAMTPGNVAAEAASIDVPVFLAVGDRDITGPPDLLPMAYPSSPAVTLHVVPTSGHHVFVAPGAASLYSTIANWLDGLTRTSE